MAYRLSGLILVGVGVVSACGDDGERNFGVPSDAGASSERVAFDAGGEYDASSTTSSGRPPPIEAGTSVAPAPTNGGDYTESTEVLDSSGASTASGQSPVSNSTTGTGAATSDGEGQSAPTASESLASTLGATSTDPETTAPLDPWTRAGELLNNQNIVQIAITLPDESVTGLHNDASTYVHGALEVTLADGETLALSDIGVRLKGRLGSARTLDEKCSFLLKANEFVKGQRLFGLNKLAVNNLVQDASMLHEQLAYELFRAMGVPAPRTGYARVTVNGQLKGLYATIEVVDNAEFLDHWFPNSDGNLYEGSYGSDFFTDAIPTFDQDRGTDVAFGDLYELTDALDSMTNPETFETDVAPWVDLDAYVAFAATELYLSHWDGYAATRNNYFVYRPVGAQWQWIPWGTDQTFGDAWASVWNGYGRLQQMCEASLACRQKLAAAYSRLSALVAELDLLGEVDTLETLISEAAAEDPGKEYDTETVHYAIGQLRDYLQNRPPAVASDMRCIDPSTVDEDGDGVSGCDHDCNDANAAVYPGAYEACNLVDDDCNDLVDEANGCPQCVTIADESGDEYAFCFQRITYWAAQAECENLGGTLASIHTQDENDWLTETSSSLNVGTSWWIGLDDSYEEGVFRWGDGSDLDFAYWHYGEPNDWGGYEDCAELTSGAWNDLPCGYELGYICKL